jgi:hypothetical protein
MGEITTQTWTPTEIRASQRDEDFYAVPATILQGETLAKGTVVGVVTLTGKVKAYASGNSDGSEVPVGVIQEAVDAALADKQSSVYIKGMFVESKLTGVDANAITLLKAKSVFGMLIF